MRSVTSKFAGLVLASAAGLSATTIVKAGFTAGDLVLLRGGDSSHSMSSYGPGEVPAYLDEYSVVVNAAAGTASLSVVGSTPVNPKVLTLPGVAAESHEGRLNLSADGHYLGFAGYNAVVSSTTPRVTDGSGTGSYYQVAQVGADGVIATQSLNAAVTHPQYLRATASLDGSNVYVATKNPSGGLGLITGFNTASPTTVALQQTTDWRDLKVNGGQLYGGTGSSSVGTHGEYAIGTGLPTSGTPTNTLLSNSSDNSGSQISFVTLPGTSAPINGVSGANVEYVVGSPSGNSYIGKLVVGAGNTPLTTNSMVFAGRPSLTSTLTSEPEGVLAQIDATNSSWVDLFITTSSGIYFGIDKSGSSTGDMTGTSFSKILDSGVDTGFYGLAPAPTAVPEPTSVALVLPAALALLSRRRA